MSHLPASLTPAHKEQQKIIQRHLIPPHFLRKRVRLTVANLGSWLTDLRFGSMNIVPKRPLEIQWQWCQHWRQRNILLRTQRKPGLTTKSTNAKNEAYLAELRRTEFTKSMFALTQNQRKNNSSAFLLALPYKNCLFHIKKIACAYIYIKMLICYIYTYIYLCIHICVYICTQIFNSILFLLYTFFFNQKL